VTAQCALLSAASDCQNLIPRKRHTIVLDLEDGSHVQRVLDGRYHLMRRYQVDVPLRTQGWINDKLISVTIENGKCEHLRYMRSKGAQCSQKIFDCMHELILKACSETEE